MHFRHPRNRGDHRDGRLAAAGHHIDVALVEVGREVDHRHAVWANRRRRQVDDADPRLRFAQRGIVFDVRPGAGGVEDEVDIGKLRHLHQAAHPFVGGRYPHAPGAGQTIRLRVDADHHRHFKMLAVAQNFNH
ncbi:hypothetical protein SB00610_05172 [Klebsiella quasipneumoniae subsp. similipneumoniae]|nr:hypothetical protein SB00610_05172 [Klebsiella quasipneumoniae subsp. similipneumoniae]